MMKQLIRFALMLIAVLALASCTPSTPGAALKEYMSALSDKDYEKFINMDATYPKRMPTRRKKYVRDLLPWFRKRVPRQLKRVADSRKLKSCPKKWPKTVIRPL